MSMTADQVKAKIRKLIALGTNDGATEAERERAMSQAHKFAAKYNLDLAELSEGPTDDRTHKTKELANNPANRRIMNSICRLFMVTYLYETKGKTHHFIGTELNTTVAIEMSEWIIKTARSESNRRADEQCNIDGTPQSAFKTAFMHAVADTLYWRVSEIIKASAQQKSEHAKPGKELVLASVYKQEMEANKELCNKLWGGIGEAKKRRARQALDVNAYQQGVAHANSVNLNKQIAD